MKKFTLILITIIATALSVNAGEFAPKKGYRGFVSLGGTASTSSLSYDKEKDTFNSDVSSRFTLSTVHGYQIIPQLFVGAGAQLNWYCEGDKSFSGKACVPLFFNLRTDILTTKVTPVIDFRAGYSVGGIQGFYCQPAAGVRIGFRNIGLNILLGYEVQKVSKLSGEKVNIDGHLGGLNLSVGVDF